MYEMLYVSVQGASHLKNDIPCEDSGKVYEYEHGKIFAVADGHGDSNCPRSQFGSFTACEVAVESLEKFGKEISDNSWEGKLLSDGEERDRLIRHLIVSIVGNWTTAVNHNYTQQPLTDEERAGCSRYIDRYDKGERIEHIYGTTLIAGLLTDTYLLLLQQGDGRCVVFSEDGKVTQPIPWDDRCFANITTSMCDEDVIDGFRFHVIDLSKERILACLAGSDGVEDSFPSMDYMHVYYRKLLSYACDNGVDSLQLHLQDTLPEFSRSGSGDDVTICGFLDTELLKEVAASFQRDDEIVVQNGIIKDMEDRLKSMNGMGKGDALKAEFEAAQNECKEAERSFIESEAKMSQFLEDRGQIKKEPGIFDRFLRYFGRGDESLEQLDVIQEKLKKEKEDALQRWKTAQEKVKEKEEALSSFVERQKEYETKKDEAKQRIKELNAE